MREKSGWSSLPARGVIAALCAALLLTACGGDEEPETKTVAAEPSAPAAAPAPAPVAATPADTPAAAAKPVLAVEEEGLRLFDAGSGSARPLAFGLPTEQVVTALEGILGKAERGTHSECGAGSLDFANWKDGLSLLFQEGRFVGWALDERGGGTVSTASGIRPGSTRRELEAAYQITVDETSLGTEFMAGAITGVLDGKGPDARITNMWAGVNCVFR